MEVSIMASKKHYIITSITLGLIAASSAVLIGVTNLVTRDQIAQNERNKILSGISEIYGENSLIKEEKAISDVNLKGEYKYLDILYTIEDNNEQRLGYAFKTSGSNMYGKIALIIGFDEVSHGFMSLTIVVNEQTYASTLVDKYINPLNDGSRALNDTSCGATYGAKLVEAMVDECKNAAQELWS